MGVKGLSLFLLGNYIMDFVDKFRDNVRWSNILPWFLAILGIGLVAIVVWNVFLLKSGGKEESREHKTAFRNLKYAWDISKKFIKENWGFYVVQFLLILVWLPISTIAVSSVSSRLTDVQSKLGNDPKTANRKLGAWHIFMGVFILAYLTKVLRYHFQQLMVPRATAMISAELFDRYLRNYETAYSETDEGLGDVLYAVRSVTDDIQWLVIFWFTDIIILVAMLSILTIYMSTVRIKFGIASFIFSILILGTGLIYNIRIVQKVIRFFNTERKIIARGEQYVVNAGTISSFNARSEIGPDLKQYTREMVEARQDFTNTETGYNAAWRVLILCFFGFVMYSLLRPNNKTAASLPRNSMQTLIMVLIMLMQWLLDVSSDLVDMVWRFASIGNMYASDLFNESKSAVEDSKKRFQRIEVAPDTELHIDNMGFRYDEELARAGRATVGEASEMEQEAGGSQESQEGQASSWTIIPFSLTAKPQDKIVIKGKSGSGKSTLLKLMAGFETPTTGQIRLGKAVSDVVSKAAWRQHVLFVSQKWSLFSGSILTNMTIGTGIHGIKAADLDAFLAHYGLNAIIPDVAQQVGNSAATGGGQMSGGMGKLIVLCRAFLRIMPDEMFSTFFKTARRSHPRPHVVLFDEPLAALDEHSRAKITRLIRQTTEGPCITFFIMHNDEMDSQATKVLNIVHGKVESN